MLRCGNRLDRVTKPKTMKGLFILFVTALTINSALAQQITIKDSKVRVSFLFIDDDVDGTISDFKFTGDINLDALETSTISGTVATETIDTDNWLRNRHLRNKYFKADDFPTLSFKSKAIKASGKKYIVTGDLTIKGITKSVEFLFSITADKLQGKASINTSDFDIVIHDEKERNELNIFVTMLYSRNM